MDLINPKDLKRIGPARAAITTLQERLLACEQALEDLSRAVEIAEVTKQYELVSSFRQTAEEQLKDRLVIPTIGEDQDLKIKIYE